MKPKALLGLQIVMWMVCAFHVITGVGLNLSSDFVDTAAKMYGAEVTEWSPQFLYILRPLGLFMLALGVLAGAAALKPLQHRMTIYVFAGIFVVRAFHRIIFGQEISEIFGIASSRNHGQHGVLLRFGGSCDRSRPVGPSCSREQPMSKRPILTLIVMLILPGVSYSQVVTPHALAATRLHRLDPQDPQGLQALFRYTGDPLPLVSAHRGGPQPKYPENCIATFQNTLQHTFAILEIDPRYTKDGAIVVLHDATLERTTTGSGPVAERTLEELKALRLKDTVGAVTEFQIPTLDEVLRWARGKTILVLDQKTVPVAARVKKIEEHRAESYAMLIVYSFKDAQTCYKLNKNIMMEVMIPNREKFQQFDKTGVPWSNIVAFVGHTPPQDKELLHIDSRQGDLLYRGHFQEP